MIFNGGKLLRDLIGLVLGSCRPAIILSIGALTSTLQSQTFEPRFSHLTIEDGLALNTINSILQDQQGFMWMGSEGGLHRYDGNRFVIYTHDRDDSTSISDSYVLAICQDRMGVLWIGTRGGGLNRYDPVADAFEHFKHDPQDPASLSNNYVLSLHEDHDGVLWIGTENGLNALQSSKDGRRDMQFIRFRHDPQNSGSLSHDVVTTIHEHGYNRLWVGTRNGLNKLRLGRELSQKSTFVHFEHGASNPNSLSHSYVKVVFEDSGGVLWVGTRAGLDKLAPASGVRPAAFQHLQIRAEHNRSAGRIEINEIYESLPGVLWVGTSGSGVMRLNTATGETSLLRHSDNNPNSLGSDHITAVHCSNDGVMWIGVKSQGIAFFATEQQQFGHWKHEPGNPNSLSANGVYRIYEDRDGIIWLATRDQGLNRFDRAKAEFRGYQHDPLDPSSLSHNYVQSLLEDQAGGFWVGTQNGLDKLDRATGKFTHYLHDPGDPNSLSSSRSIKVTCQDRSGMLWIGTRDGGLNRFDPVSGEFRHWLNEPGNPNSLNNNYVLQVYEDNAGVLWIATNGGLAKMADGKFTQFRHNPDDMTSISNDKVRCIYQDKSGVLWLGTYGGGLNRFDQLSGTFKHYQKKDGLGDNAVYGILEDDWGNLWLSTNHGISKFNPDNETFTHFDASDGLQSNEFNFGGYFRSRSGEMLFGGINGFNIFHPDSIRDNMHAPPVVVTDFQIFNNSLGPGEELDGRAILQNSIARTRHIALSYTDRVFSFEFAALHYVAPTRNQFAYMMEGFEDSWNHVGNRRFATYTNLAAGEYRFKVKAANSDGVWNQTGAAIDITIQPPFWQTLWFRGTTALVVSLLILCIYKLRVRSIENQNRRLEREVAERTEELRSKKDELEEKTEHLQQTLQELKETKDELIEEAHKAGMAEIATGALHNVGNVLNSVTTCASVIATTLGEPRLARFVKANDLLRNNLDDVDSFILENPKGRKLLDYYLKLEDSLVQEHDLLEENAERLSEKIKLMSDVISTQQQFARGKLCVEELSLSRIVEDVLKLQGESTLRHRIKIDKKFENVPNVRAQKTKLIHVLLNLYKNARDAMEGIDAAERQLTFELKHDTEYAYLRISDTGVGINQANLNRIFQHGFTTKAGALGFGLHNCANYMTEMAGTMSAESDGEGKGATFILCLPLSHENATLQ